MAIISPFKGITFNMDRVKAENVITQPYDKISPDAREGYYKASPYNIVRIVKGVAEENDSANNNVYTRAAGYFKRWLAEGVLLKSEKPAYYYLEQKYEIEDVSRIRKGLICMGRAEEYDAEVVFPHEQTLKGPKIDRMELFRATKGSFGQIFLLYNDRDKIVDRLASEGKKEAYLSFTGPDGVIHTLYQIDDAETIRSFSDAMKDKQLFIADGHHRYETALAFKNEMSEKYPDAGNNAAFKYCMMTLVNMDDEGMTVLPTHRLVKNVEDFDSERLIEKLKPDFEIEELAYNEDNPDASAKICLDRLAGEKSTAFATLFSDTKKLLLLKLKDVSTLATLENHSDIAKSLDITILHDAILDPCLGIDKQALAEQKNLDYRRNAKNCIEMTLNGEYQAVFLLNATKVEQVRDMALNRETMPQKSTDFYPKVLTGFVMGDISENEKL